jgi:Ca2+-binding RTX toxin-like protein
MAAPADAGYNLTCNYDAPSSTVAVNTDADASGAIAIELARNGTAIEARSYIGGNPNFNVGCGAATVDNTDTVNMTGSGVSTAFQIRQSDGPFAPGATTELSGTSEIEINVNLGAGGANETLMVGSTPLGGAITAGSNGVNLNADNDPDLTVTAMTKLTLVGSSANDTLSAAGNAITASPIAVPVAIAGGGGNDTIRGGAMADSLVGQTGNDTLLPFGDGGDSLSGGPGTDTVSYKNATGGVIVTLDGTANDGRHQGAVLGTDNAQTDVENLLGTGFADRLTGTKGVTKANKLTGAGGKDVIGGLAGNDYLIGGVGADKLTGGPGRDRCVGGAGTDTTRTCERLT